MTYEEIKRQCEKFYPGDMILVNVVKRDEEGRRARIEKAEGTIKELSTHVIVVERGGALESFTYIDVVLNGALVKKKGRKNVRGIR